MGVPLPLHLLYVAPRTLAGPFRALHLLVTLSLALFFKSLFSTLRILLHVLLTIVNYVFLFYFCSSQGASRKRIA